MTPKEYGDLLILSIQELRKIGWHWFAYHFQNGPTPFADSIIYSCGSINNRAPEIGTDLLKELIAIGGREKDECQYNQLLQKMSEILIINRIVHCPWPNDTTFEHEPSAIPGGPRPELLITHPGGRLAIEVKTPSLLKHIRERWENDIQLPYRESVLRDTAHGLTGGSLTLPKDNQILSYLRDAERKFSGFRTDQTACLLVIVWDDFIYEPISVLANTRSGLLTNQSYSKISDGSPERFENIDNIIAVRHLDYFIRGSREEFLGDRRSAMDFGDKKSLPNVIFHGHGGKEIPDFVISALRSVPYDNDALQHLSEYQPLDMVMWLNSSR